MNFLSLFCVFVIYKFASNLYFLLRTKFFYKEFKSLLDDKTKRSIPITEYMHEVKYLFTKAKIKNRSLSFMREMGFGYAKEAELKMFDNIFTIDYEITPLVNQSFNEAIGVFKYRMRQSINPIYWVEFAIFLPKHVLEFFDIDSSKQLSNLIQFIYWVLSIFVFIYSDEVREILRKVIEGSLYN